MFAVLLSAPVATVFAHGGEDHGEEKAATVSTSANMMVRTARAGDLEVTVKHAPVEPDKETAARIFVTNFDTNEPTGRANVALLVTAGGGATIEATATASATAGMYEVKLPPLPQGEYKLSARIQSGGATRTVEYGAVRVAPAPATPADDGAPWARTALIVFGALVGLGLIGFVLRRVAHGVRRDRTARETAAA